MNAKVIPVRNLNELPGTKTNMFFEMYNFEPLPTFGKNEGDVYHILKFFDFVFGNVTEIPDKLQKHFFRVEPSEEINDALTKAGLEAPVHIFNPQEDITIDEFADILTLANLTITKEVFKSLPKNVQEHFVQVESVSDSKEALSWIFSPYEDFNLTCFKDFMSTRGLVQLSINKEQFEQLPTKRLKRQFIVLDRSGKSWRWGARVP